MKSEEGLMMSASKESCFNHAQKDQKSVLSKYGQYLFYLERIIKLYCYRLL